MLNACKLITRKFGSSKDQKLRFSSLHCIPHAYGFVGDLLIDQHAKKSNGSLACEMENAELIKLQHCCTTKFVPRNRCSPFKVELRDAMTNKNNFIIRNSSVNLHKSPSGDGYGFSLCEMWVMRMSDEFGETQSMKSLDPDVHGVIWWVPAFDISPIWPNWLIEMNKSPPG